MDLRQVEYVLAVVDHGGFTRAAHALHVAQPSLSQSVRRLERELGTALFVRAARRVRLTAAGEAFVGPARRLLREADNVVATVATHVAGTAGTVDVVALATLAVDPLAAAVGRLRREHPGVAVRVVEPDTVADLAARVRDGRAELGVTEAGAVPDPLVEHPIGVQELVAVLPPGSSGGAPGITLAELARRPLVLGPAGASVRQVLERALDDVGALPTIAVEVAQREAILPLVLAGAGATAVPRPLGREAAADGAVVVPFRPPLERPVSVVHRDAPLSPGARALLGLLTSGG